MAGFAVHLDLLLQNPNATMPYKSGYEEDGNKILFCSNLYPVNHVFVRFYRLSPLIKSRSESD